MQVNISNELGYTELIIEEQCVYQDNYQITMLKECNVAGLLPVVSCGVDDKSQYIYDISGMKSVASLFEIKPLRDIQIQEFGRQLLAILQNVKLYMLDVNKIILDPKYIFRKGDTYHFCYYPLKEESANNDFHLLTEYLVKVIDYDHVETVRLVGGMHKATMEDHYELSEILENMDNNPIEDYKGVSNESASLKDEDLRDVGDIWTQNIVESNEESDSDNCTEKKASRYMFNNENQWGNRIREVALWKIWGKQESDSEDKTTKVKIKKVTPNTWGDWDDLLKEKL